MTSWLDAVVDVASSATMYQSAFRLAVLLGFAAIGEWVAERSGTLNISVEAMILTGAFAAAAGHTATGSSLVGLVAGMGAGAAVALIQAQLSHRLTADQFVVGLTLNVLALGLTGFLAATVDLGPARAATVTVPLLSRLPLVGPALFAQAWPAYLIYGAVPGLWWLVHRTRWGLEVRACGEDPRAADLSGVAVQLRRRQALVVDGVLCGLGGAYFVLGQVGVFQQNMTNGRGFLAIAAVIFGGWTLRGTLAGCVLFGMADALRLTLPNLGHELNGALLAALPYGLALLALLVVTRRSRGPAALAVPFVRGWR